MGPRLVGLVGSLVCLAASAHAEEPVASPDAPPETPVPAPATATVVPLAQLVDERGGEAFIGQELAIEGTFMGMWDIEAAGPINVPRKYRKTHTRFWMGGEAGSSTRNLIIPTEQAGPLYSMALGTKLRVTGTLEHMMAPALVQPTSANRLLVVSKLETL